MSPKSYAHELVSHLGLNEVMREGPPDLISGFLICSLLQHITSCSVLAFRLPPARGLSSGAEQIPTLCPWTSQLLESELNKPYSLQVTWSYMLCSIDQDIQ